MDGVRFLPPIGPGVSGRELSGKGCEIPEELIADRNPMIMHGIGMGDEYPSIALLRDGEAIGHDGVIEQNVTLCVESCIGALGRNEGVKLDEQTLVADRGGRTLSQYPCEEH